MTALPHGDASGGEHRMTPLPDREGLGEGQDPPSV